VTYIQSFCELVIPAEVFKHLVFHTIPGLNIPSCRYLPSRVLTPLNYDAYRLRQALIMPRPLIQQPPERGSIQILFSFRLQPTSGFSLGALTGLGTRILLGFIPSQRHHYYNATDEIPTSPLPTHRFSQPFSRFPTLPITRGFIPLRRHSQGSAFKGLHRRDRFRCPESLLLRRYPLYMASFLVSIDTPACLTMEDYPFPRYYQNSAPYFLAKIGFHLKLEPTLEL